MALAILDGNQSATTLSTIVVSSAHIPAHTVVSLGAQAITDITSAVSSGIVISGAVTIGAGTSQIGSVTASIAGTVPISISSVTIGNFPASQAVTFSAISVSNFPATQPVSLATLPALVESTAQIGSVTASISGTIPISISSVTIGNSITISSLPALVAGTAQIGSVTASISGTVPISISSVTVGNSVTIGSLPALVAGTAEIGTVKPAKSQSGNAQFLSVDDGSGKLFTSTLLTAGTAQIGSVTASISNFPATQAISIASVTIGNSITIGSLPAISGTVTANVPLSVDGYTAVTGVRVIGVGHDGGLRIQGINPSSFAAENLEEGGGIPIFSVNNNALPISGTVTANVFGKDANSTATAQIPVISYDEGIVGAGSSYVVPVQVTNLGGQISEANPLPISGTVTANGGDFSAIVGDSMPAKAVAIGFYSGDDAGIAQVDDSTRRLPISGTVIANTFAVQGTAVTTSNFTSITPSTVLASFNATREVLTIFNEGAGNLHICGGATCTTIAYQVRLSAGDYYEVPNHQTTITHSAVFATAGTARVTQVS